VTALIVRGCRYCVDGCPDSYEIDENGKCAACGDTKTETVTQCDGCNEDGHDLAEYLVEFHDGGSEHCAYCDDCRDLAKMDWNGETKSICALEVCHG
jgi:hypothetical protein